MRTIFLSTGHNNARAYPWSWYKDKGASANNTNEFDLINPILNDIIKEGIQGFTLVKIPEGLNLSQRIKYVNLNSKDGDILFEFHLDSAPQAEGCSTYYYTGSEYAKRKATTFQMEYTRISGLKGRGVHGDTTNRLGRLGIVRDTKPLAFLVELGFVTNKEDIAKIKKYGKPAIVAGIKKIIT